MHPTYYRGFWHVVCRYLFPIKYLTRKGVYNPKAFIPHAVSRRQTCVHCARFPVAATRRCMLRISVALWLADLSVQLPVIALVRLLPHQQADRTQTPPSAGSYALSQMAYEVLPRLSAGYSPPKGRFLRITHPFATVLKRGPFDLHA